MTLGCSHQGVAQVFYKSDPQSNLPPKKKTKHVVASGKQHIIGVDGVDDVVEAVIF